MSPLLRLLVIGFTTLALFYSLVVVGMYAFQRKLLFPGVYGEKLANSAPVGRWVEIDTPDGERLTGMFVSPQPGQPVVLYFHGNGNTVAQSDYLAEAFRNAGYGFLSPSYRGYPGSTGSPSEAGILTDGLAAYDWLTREAPNSPIMLAAHSLGTGVAVNTAAEREVKAVALLSPYDSMVNTAAYNYPFLPVRLLIKDPIHSDERIPRVTAPKLFIHGDLDTLIPTARSQALFAAAPEPKTFITANGLGHNDIWNPAYFNIVVRFFEESRS